MRREIEILIDKFNSGEITKSETINEILSLSIINKNQIDICDICDKHVLLKNGCCPSCTIDFCTPIEREIKL